jgi:hypothetical protein
MDAAAPTDFSTAKFITTFVMLLMIFKSHQGSENRSQKKLNGFVYIFQISALEAVSFYITH